MGAFQDLSVVSKLPHIFHVKRASCFVCLSVKIKNIDLGHIQVLNKAGYNKNNRAEQYLSIFIKNANNEFLFESSFAFNYAGVALLSIYLFYPQLIHSQ